MKILANPALAGRSERERLDWLRLCLMAGQYRSSGGITTGGAGVALRRCRGNPQEQGSLLVKRFMSLHIRDAWPGL